jgi:hypothetical protein
MALVIASTAPIRKETAGGLTAHDTTAYNYATIDW